MIKREQKGWSVNDLINKLEEPDYEKYELGELQVTNELANKLGNLYELDASYFLANKSSMTNYNIGKNSHSNMIIRPNVYIDINYEAKEKMAD
jgi:ribosome-binding protein aMBF1 (putative translation factor)